MSNFYQGVNIKSISLFILTIITITACSKQDPTKFKPSQLNGTWTGSENQQDETTFNVSNLAGSWKSADGAEQSYSIDKVDGKISGSGSSPSDIFIGKEIPNWKTTTDMVPEFEFEITHNGKIDKFRFISSTKGYVNDKLYYRQ